MPKPRSMIGQIRAYKKAIYNAGADRRAKNVMKETRDDPKDVQIAVLDNTLRRLRKGKK